MQRRQPRGVRGALLELDVYYGWVVVAACFLAGMVCFGTIYTFGVFFEYIHAEFGGGYAGTSLVFSVQSIVTFGGGAVLGFVVDRYGTRRLLLVAGGLLAVGLVAVGRAGSLLGVTVAYGVVAALGLGICFVVAYATTPRWFGRRRGIATAVATSGAGVGIVLMPGIAQALIDALGWRDAYLALLAGALGLLGLAALLVADHPESVGADASGEFGGDEPAVTRDGLRAQVAAVASLCYSRAFALVFAGYVMLFTPAYMLLVHVVEFATVAGVGRSAGVLAIGVIGATNVAGKFVFGGVADWLHTRAAVLGCGLFAGGGTLLLAAVAGEASLLVGVLVFGLGYGGAAAVLSPYLAALFGAENINALLGVTSVAFALTGSLAPLVAGLSYDLAGSFVPGFLGGGLLGLLAGPVLLLAARGDGAAG